MSKPRIITADTDINYIISFQTKVVEEYYEKAELEIITDREYFKEFFSLPQKVDVLIVSEELYEPSLLRHDIGTIFVLMEQFPKKGTDDQQVTYLFKYSSTREIFDKINGKNRDIFIKESGIKKKTQILLVYSANGGTGKTTVALGVGACLAEKGKRTLYINASYLQSFQWFLKDQSTITDSEFYIGMLQSEDIDYDRLKSLIRKEGLYYVPPFKAALRALGLSYRIYEKITLAAQNSGDYDFIIIDADSIFEADIERLMDIADKILIVIRPVKGSAYAVNALEKNMNKTTWDKCIVVCNDFEKGDERAFFPPELSLEFTVMEYISHLDHYDELGVEDLVNEADLQKLTILVN